MSAIRDAAAWVRETFPEANAHTQFKKAEAEWGAFYWVSDPAETIEEAADVVIALAGYVALIGGDLEAAVRDKLAANRARTWQQMTGEETER